MSSHGKQNKSFDKFIHHQLYIIWGNKTFCPTEFHPGLSLGLGSLFKFAHKFTFLIDIILQ